MGLDEVVFAIGRCSHGVCKTKQRAQFSQILEASESCVPIRRYRYRYGLVTHLLLKVFIRPESFSSINLNTYR